MGHRGKAMVEKGELHLVSMKYDLTVKIILFHIITSHAVVVLSVDPDQCMDV